MPEVFNAAIEARLAAGTLLRGEQTRDEILVFVHDDVWLDDAQIGEHLLSGLDQFDVIGVAGSVGRVAGQLNTIANTGLRFDSRFDFHFYDVHFCRTARSLGLRLGTWPIALTHQSGGSFGDDWRCSHAEYLAKWGD